jgi:hypothetical protein
MATDAKDANLCEAQTPCKNPPTQTAPPRPLVAPDGTELAEDDSNLDLWRTYYLDCRAR